MRVELNQRGSIAVLSFANPPTGYMDGETEEQLSSCLDRIEENDDIRVVILTGSQQDVFIRHYDVSVLYERSLKMAEKGLSFSIERPVPETLFHICLRRIEAMPKPFIAAINGTAMGGGFELALACDLRLVQDGPYELGLPEVNLGILPGAGGTQRLTRLIGEAKALELELLGRTFGPKEAVIIGVASECVVGDVMNRAMEIAETLSQRSPKAIGHIKKLIKGAARTDLDVGLANERTLFCDLMVDDYALQEMGRMAAGERDIQDPKLAGFKKSGEA